jgi:hypothetical protein
VDNCPALATPILGDRDGDGLGDACDRCTGGTDGSPHPLVHSLDLFTTHIDAK